MVSISIVKDFSRTPGPRYIAEGDYSGESFRKEHLLPNVMIALENDEDIIVDLDGASGYGTSFLEESFGGLLREDKISYDFIKKHLKIKSDEDDIYIDEIWDYIEKAHKAESEAEK